MRRLRWIVSLWVTVALAPGLGAQTVVPSEVVSVGLFKNGLAVVKRQVQLERGGLYRIEDAPIPVHGTFWIESDAKLTTRAATRVVERPSTRGDALDLQDDLAGLDVTVRLRDRPEFVIGQVVSLPPAKTSWSRAYEQGRMTDPWGRRYSSVSTPWLQRFLVLQTGTGRSYLELTQIVAIHVAGDRGTVRREQPALMLDVEGDRPATVQISYLSQGMTWAPSYRVDISNPRRLRIEQSAVIRNELLDVADAELQLISGFPSVQFGHVTSPLSASSNLAAFFAQLNQQPRGGHDTLLNVISQQSVAVQPNAPGFDSSAIPTGDGLDLHYQSIGRQTLAEGDSLALHIAAAEADYERIVEWTIPDSRDPQGQQMRAQQDDTDAIWDALRFRNPFAFPMTTAPAMIVAHGRFNGQRTSYWVDAGELTTLQVNRALSVRALHSEQEEPDERQYIHVGGKRYRRVLVKGDLVINNHRREDVRLVIRREFSGDLTQATGDPTVTLAEAGDYSVNRRNVMVWSIPVQSGQEQRLTYQYTVLVAY